MTVQQQKDFITALQAWTEKQEEIRILKKYPVAKDNGKNLRP